MQRHIGPSFGKAAVDFDHLPRVAVLQGNAVAGEAQRIEQVAVFPGAVEHWRDRIVVGVAFLLGRIDAAAIHADAYRAVFVGGDAGEIAHLLLPRL